MNQFAWSKKVYQHYFYDNFSIFTIFQRHRVTFLFERGRLSIHRHRRFDAFGNQRARYYDHVRASDTDSNREDTNISESLFVNSSSLGALLLGIENSLKTPPPPQTIRPPSNLQIDLAPTFCRLKAALFRRRLG